MDLRTQVMNGLRPNGGKAGNQGLAWRERGRDGVTRSWGRSAKGVEWERIPEAAYTENPARGKKEWGQTP